MEEELLYHLYHFNIKILSQEKFSYLSNRPHLNIVCVIHYTLNTSFTRKTLLGRKKMSSQIFKLKVSSARILIENQFVDVGSIRQWSEVVMDRCILLCPLQANTSIPPKNIAILLQAASKSAFIQATICLIYLYQDDFLTFLPVFKSSSLAVSSQDAESKYFSLKVDSSMAFIRQKPERKTPVVGQSTRGQFLPKKTKKIIILDIRMPFEAILQS